MPSHYLDFAATSAVRPQVVADAVHRFLTECGATPGKGGHAPAVEAGRVALRCRRSVQEILGVQGDPGRVAFMQNATQAINTALWGLLRPGDAVCVTVFDHNAVLRPADYLARTRGVEVRMIPGSPDGELDLDAAEQLIPGCRVVVVNSASNVLGTRLPLRTLSALAHEAGAVVLLDAAQGAGHFPMHAAEDGADVVAFTGHKGMLGPQGVGGLWVRVGLDIEPLLRGGTGGDSKRREMPADLPDRLEAGTVNAPGLAGLEAGIRWVLDRGVDQLGAHESRLKTMLWDGLDAMSGVSVLSPRAPDGVGLVTIAVDGVLPSAVAETLDRGFGVHVRPGLHCAPEAHRVLGTLDYGATRISVGWSSTEQDVQQALVAVEAARSS